MSATMTTAAATPSKSVENWTRLHAEGYFANHRWYKDRLHDLGLKQIAGMLEPQAEDVLLEIGCGYGRLLWHFLPRVSKVIGVELADEPLREAADLLRGRGEHELIRNDGLTLAGVADGSVTAIYSFTVLQHMTRAGAKGYMREAFRVLSRGGRICVQFNCDGAAKESDILDEVREQSLSYTAAQACEVLESAGLRVERVERECLEPIYPGRGLSWLWVLAVKP